jgi:hypothetical protein
VLVILEAASTTVAAIVPPGDTVALISTSAFAIT